MAKKNRNRGGDGDVWNGRGRGGGRGGKGGRGDRDRGRGGKGSNFPNNRGGYDSNSNFGNKNFNSNRDGNKFNRGGNNFNRGSNNFNRGGNNFHKGGHSNFNDRGNFNNRGARHSSGSQSNSSNRLRPFTCSRCESNGHSTLACLAEPVPEDSTCPCGNIFHYPTHCPYNHDPSTRDDVLFSSTGKFCTWCKDTGDGLHTFDGCTRALAFKRDLQRIQRHEYLGIGFCWHCRDKSHLSHVCDSNTAELDRARWAAHITDAMEAWTGWQEGWFRDAYREDEVDVLMKGDIFSQRRAPPEAAMYQWCVMCEEFGHGTGTKEGGCDTRLYDERRPRDVPIMARRRPYVPKGFQTRGFTAARKGGRMLVCSGKGCEALLGPWYFPAPKLGQHIKCPSCGLQNEHPDQEGKMSLPKDLEELIREVLEEKKGKKGKKSETPGGLSPRVLAMYEKRPSLKLQLTLARGQKLGTVSPRNVSFTDGARYNTFSPVFHNQGEYWKYEGNFQDYFPALTFPITEQMAADAVNDGAAINLVGRLGMKPECSACKAPIVVCDDESDVVMRYTAWENTLGEGQGVGYFLRSDNTYDLNVCDCPQSFLGYRGSIGWKLRGVE